MNTKDGQLVTKGYLPNIIFSVGDHSHNYKIDNGYRKLSDKELKDLFVFLKD